MSLRAAILYPVGAHCCSRTQYQSCFNISLARYNTFATLCTLSFLAMAETLHLRYGRLSPDQLRAHVHAIGHGTFAIVNAIPDLGVIIIRTVEIFATAESPAVAVCLTLLSALPAVVIPLVIHVVKLLKGWARKYRRKDSGGEEEGINGGTGENTPA
ncbi:hypothetical protein HYDPIDRAFT_31590 [Hydnomerulius pinastri MD-312]|uniref:Uncharacterized protein n=1 Tax=Hydnomerulius pinastri MD-312 TaxID=994086 RepID=A0A0C9W416_9AGAM|nr:hypothetical protein HYDPIDRAFT_31590 [Hydnomerulius pinastri MD-312]